MLPLSRALNTTFIAHLTLVRRQIPPLIDTHFRHVCVCVSNGISVLERSVCRLGMIERPMQHSIHARLPGKLMVAGQEEEEEEELSSRQPDRPSSSTSP